MALSAQSLSAQGLSAPGQDCARCPRLATWREELRQSEPDWVNAPVPSFGSLDSRLLIVGLAPGLRGANRTGRPFTGDYAGDLLYTTLIAHGLATGLYAARPDDGLRLIGTRITNAVRCVPPENKPLPTEIAACRSFLGDEIAAMPNLRVILALGQISHQQILTTIGVPRSRFPFRHGAQYQLEAPIFAKGTAILADSYHCSRYNTNTGRLTSEMFTAVFAEIAATLG